jgi:hypothetical protein
MTRYPSPIAHLDLPPLGVPRASLGRIILTCLRLDRLGAWVRRVLT